MKIRIGVALLSTLISAAAGTSQWPQFRGPNCSGVAEGANPPIQFGPDTNLVWKLAVPSGRSSPVVSDDHIFLTGVESNHLVTLSVDAKSGRELWRRTAPAEKLESCHEFSSPAAPTPCTDGLRVFSYFGSFGLIAYDFSGNELWRRPFALLSSRYGTATSPILAGGKLILQRLGGSTNSEILALEPATGNTIWRVSCPLAKESYSTPMLWQHDGMEELLVQSLGRLTAYTLDRGQASWWVKGWNFDAVMTTPVAGDGLLFAGGSGINDPSEPDPIFDWKKSLARFDANHDGQIAISELPPEEVWHMRKEVPKGAPGSVMLLTKLFGFIDANDDKIITKTEWDVADSESRDPLAIDCFAAIRPGGKDDATETHIAWKISRGLPEIPSTLYYRGSLYLVRDGGMWTAIDAPSGKVSVDRERLGIFGQFVASPVAANGYIYAASESGTIAVIRAENKLEVAALNKLGESVRTTPAIAGRALYVRTEKHLMAFAAQ